MKKLNYIGMILFTSIFYTFNAYALVVCINGNGDLIKEQRTVESFRTLVIKCSADVTFGKSGAGGVQIECDQNIMPFLYSRVVNCILTIGSDTIICPTKININLAADNLQAISIDGSGRIFSELPIITDNFSIKLSGSGSIELKSINTKDLSIEVMGSGNVYIAGTTDKYTAYMDGSGTLNTEDMLAQRAGVSLAGSGLVKVNVNERISSSINGSGMIEYQCSTNDVNNTITGSGIIRKKENNPETK